MKYKGKAVEIIGSKSVFGKEILWIRVLEDNTFLQIAAEDLEDITDIGNSMSNIRFTALAARIKEDIARKKLLAPYESSLIPLPHQLLVLEKVMNADQTRFLLADEVGMGKTIEAGLILKELKLRGEVKRTLLIVPKSAIIQWQSELKEHFNESFHIYDAELISSLSRTFAGINTGDEEFNFWSQHHQIIVSLDALKPLEKRQGWSEERVSEYNKYRMEAVLNAGFDMVIIDEVHKMGGNSSSVSRYVLADALCNVVPNALLLSATPHRGKSDHFNRILRLIDSEAFAEDGIPAISEIEPYVIRTEKRLAIDYDGNKLFNDRETQRLFVELDRCDHRLQVDLYNAVTEYVKKGFNAAKRKKNSATGLVMIMFQRLASSSTSAIQSAMETRLRRLQAGDDADMITDYYAELDISDDFDGFALDDYSVSTTDQLQNEEELLDKLISKAKRCQELELDAKATTLVETIKRLRVDNLDPHLKILVFTEFRTTQNMLKRVLSQSGMICETINGSQSIEERRRSLLSFKESSDVMIATDAAGESLNMQFCHVVFNYDLPWNPMMIEQRIGRIDRIGQKNKVIAYNMLTNNSVDCRVYEVIVEKLNIILSQLGIDKTSDVLDSTIDMHNINNLYLQSLLDPRRFEFAGDKWLNEIQKKLKDFHSTKGILPLISEEEIDNKAASAVKYSPLPIWLEDMMIEYVSSMGGNISRRTDGSITFKWEHEQVNAVFDVSLSLDNPMAEHITLQHRLAQKLLNSVNDVSSPSVIPVLCSKDNSNTQGFWSLWEVAAINTYETKTTYIALFVSDQDKVFTAYGNEIWANIVETKNYFNLCGTIINEKAEELFSSNKLVSSDALQNCYDGLRIQIEEVGQKRYQKRMKAINYSRKRIEKIGIDNIRKSRLGKLEAEEQKWVRTYAGNSSIVPDVKHLITVRIDG